jgi:hypothetical protein
MRQSISTSFAFIKDVRLPIDWFKISPPKIIYHLLSKEHVNEINAWIIVYNKFDIKVLVFAIPKDLKIPNSIFPHRLKKWEDIHNS